MHSLYFLSSILFISNVTLSTASSLFASEATKPRYPTRVIANVSVIDTPLVRAAESFARVHSTDTVFNHVMRGWLYGVLILNHNPKLREAVDLEVHAVATILHDLGLDETPGSPIISPNRRFEVDGAIAARDFINRHTDGKKWSKPRIQLVWDSIALHTQESIFAYKEPDVQIVARGVTADFSGPIEGITEQEYASVLKTFPKHEFIPQVKASFVWLCQTKPQTTYGEFFCKRQRIITDCPTDTFMQPWGEKFVANYSAEGHRSMDMILGLQYP